MDCLAGQMVWNGGKFRLAKMESFGMFGRSMVWNGEKFTAFDAGQKCGTKVVRKPSGPMPDPKGCKKLRGVGKKFASYSPSCLNE